MNIIRHILHCNTLRSLQFFDVDNSQFITEKNISFFNFFFCNFVIFWVIDYFSLHRFTDLGFFLHGGEL